MLELNLASDQAETEINFCNNFQGSLIFIEDY